MADTSNSRTYRDITLFTVATTVLLGRMRNIRRASRNAAIAVSGGTDTWQTTKPGLNSEEITGEMNVWNTSALAAALGTAVAFTTDLGGKTEIGTGILSATGSDWAHNGAEGETFTITVTGTPSLA